MSAEQGQSGSPKRAAADAAGGAAPIAVEIRSPDGPIWSGRVESLKVPESLGLMGILPGHAALMASLETGLTTLRQPGGVEVKLITGAGFLEVDSNRVLMLVDFGEDPAKVDARRAQEARDRAVARLRTSAEEVDRVRAEAALARAMVRISQAGQPRL